MFRFFLRLLSVFHLKKKKKSLKNVVWVQAPKRDQPGKGIGQQFTHDVNWALIGIRVQQKYWMGLKSGLCADQSSSPTPNWGNHFCMVMSLCTEVLSCWNMKHTSPRLGGRWENWYHSDVCPVIWCYSQLALLSTKWTGGATLALSKCNEIRHVSHLFNPYTHHSVNMTRCGPDQ